MKLERPARDSRLPGKYVGQYPEDIYVKVGDSWFSANGEYRITGKKYITFQNYEYDIEVHAEKVQDTKQGIEALNSGRQELFALPELPNPTTDTYEYLISIAVGDDYVDRQGKQWKVTAKYFREMSGDRLKVGIYYS